jgi:transcriptional regulator
VYIPPKFRLTDDQVVDVLRAAALAHLVTPSPTGLLVTPLPLMYDGQRHSLVGHVARQNPHWREADPDAESVAIFAGPDAYVSPTFYPVKSETGKVVPTWNYETVTVHGHLQVHDDSAWLRGQVTALSDHHEAGRPQPWSVEDAPDHYVAGQLRAIVGIELRIVRWEGKAKMSQNQPERNQRGVIDGLAASDRPRDREVAARVAACTAAG